MNLIIDTLKTGIEITGLVMIMMLLIEYVNLKTHGRTFEKLQKSKTRQVLFGTLLGLIPGCVGGFAVVSLFTHRILSFGSLVAMMIASSGDEAFILLSMIPKYAIILFAIVGVIAIIAGLLTDKLFKVPGIFGKEHYQIHKMDSEHSGHSVFKGNIRENLKHMGKERAFILLGIIVFTMALVAGFTDHEDYQPGNGFNIFNEKWINYLFSIASLATLYLTAAANEHFIKSHLWEHVVKKHFKSIFLWTMGALLVIHFGMKYIDVTDWVKNNIYIVILIAVLVGLIPESGPHIVFITLFASGAVPFSVLLASSIVQDGHTTLPLLAESKKCFIKAKMINFVIGLTVGVLFHLAGW